ncbi:MAG: alpha-mannosidase [Christensenellales bacterium]|jgi:alpha-mannosidase
MIGNAHIDPVWFWHWQEGYQEIKASFRSALDRMNESPEFVFTSACADYYRWVEQNDPPMFAEIAARIREGRWSVVGGMWVQPDCNMPSGESFVRHFLYSQRYFHEKFGVTAKTAYNVDSFGHNAMLPQLFRRAGIENYVMMRPGVHENAEIPGWLFDWYAPDGSHVRTFRIPDAYSAPFGSCDADIERARNWQAERGHAMMCFYGVGNHGGGPTISNLKAIRAYQDAHPDHNVQFSSPDRYFDSVRDIDVPAWKNELQHHASGCYSATSLIKTYNRRAENALLSAETMGVIGAVRAGHTIGCMAQGWQNLLFNQFHDILCGCSIREVYEDARNQLGESISIAAREQNAAVQAMSWQVDTIAGMPGRVRSKESGWRLWEIDGNGTPLVVFNPHAFPAKGNVQVFGNIARVTDETGEDVPAQTIRASRTNGRDKWDTLLEAEIPAYGHRLYWLYLKGESAPVETALRVDAHSIENANVFAKFDSKTGALIHLIDKSTGYDAISAPARMRLFDNEHADIWAHMVFKFDDPKGDFGDPTFEVLETGPVRAKLRVTTRFGKSKLIQEYALTADADQIEVAARLDMQEKFRMAKLCFPVRAQSPVARAEIAYGVIERPCDGCEETAQRWLGVSGEAGGLALLNDSKYSFSAPDAELRLTVANTSIYADHYGQEHRDADCRHVDMGEQEFRYALVPHGGSWREKNLAHRGELFNLPLVSIVETYHEGPLGPVSEGISIDAANISVGAFKRAEDGAGYVLRLTETQGLPVQAQVDLKLVDRKFAVNLTPYELKTLYIPDDLAREITEILVTEL